MTNFGLKLEEKLLHDMLPTKKSEFQKIQHIVLLCEEVIKESSLADFMSIFIEEDHAQD